ncbi:hypothetical protein [Methanococcus vannielii]|nr:hypothetical protein [Methanococcus vannielii]
MDKKFFECKVCKDIHYGKNWPNPCPTCLTKNSYIEIKVEDAFKKLEK